MVMFLLVIFLLFFLYSVIPTIYYKLKNRMRRKMCRNIFLTFDDGPSKYTSDLLDLLKKYNVKASFFCVAYFAKEYPNILNRMNKEGHVVCLHSFKHMNAWLMGINKTSNDFKDSLNVMNKLNQKCIYYRPPWGNLNLSSLYYLKKNDLKLVLWDVMAEDWRKFTTSEEIRKKILKRVNTGDIICLHDGRGRNEAPKRTIKALEEVIPLLIEKGYRFETVDNYE